MRVASLRSHPEEPAFHLRKITRKRCASTSEGADGPGFAPDGAEVGGGDNSELDLEAELERIITTSSVVDGDVMRKASHLIADELYHSSEDLLGAIKHGSC